MAGNVVKRATKASTNEKKERREAKTKKIVRNVGQKSGHRHQDGYHDVGYADRIGQHGYHYHDKGSYAKGHCTKGTHDVHKLEELNKTKEFFDEDRGEDNHEKHGAYEIARGLGNGAFRLEGRAKKVSLADELLKSWKSDLGSHGAVDSGYGRRKGTEENFKNAEKSAERNGFDVYELVGDSWKNEAN
ncbi:uncharacterized protein LOC132704965 isoform X2 [Cylas formicarius]|uniref:uncharacterized protein LOC132704965 isoform X2 n=1 Tax=Cylas formicarius TaxID=197179 RepID=UPI002958977B|nr:uncharacterized protein LOC132704965 isoform X2 [Cylas formicarius]